MDASLFNYPESPDRSISLAEAVACASGRRYRWLMSRKKRQPTAPVAAGQGETDYAVILSDLVELLESARHAAARSANAIITTTYWEMGRRITEEEQKGQRAAYGERLIERLSLDLSRRFGRGFGVVNLSQMRKFYQVWPKPEIFQTASEKLTHTSPDVSLHRFPLTTIVPPHEMRVPFRDRRARVPSFLRLPTRGDEDIENGSTHALPKATQMLFSYTGDWRRWVSEARTAVCHEAAWGGREDARAEQRGESCLCASTVREATVLRVGSAP